MNFMKQVNRLNMLALLLCSGVALTVEARAADEAASSVAATNMVATPVFARVNGRAISVREYASRYNDTMRKRYYHAKPPEIEAAAARKEVADMLVEQELLIDEAVRRGINAEEGKVERVVADLDKRNSAIPEWQAQREVLLSMVRAQVTRQSQLEQITKILHQVPEASAEQVRAYYEQHPDVFTEPEQLRLSVITLKVDPSSSNEDWAKTREDVAALRERIVGGADFAEIARKYSQDKSAERGGDMGYLHGGMLPQTLSKWVDSFKLNEVSMPVRMLEGISLFLVKDRIPAKLRDFADVEDRARSLVQKEQEELAWKNAIAQLRAAAKIEILIPLDSNGEK